MNRKSIFLMIGVGLACGALTVLGQGALPGSWNHFANSGAVWLVAAFVVGALMRSTTWAMVGGFLSLVLALLSYTIVAAVLGYTYRFSAIALWSSVALVGGPVFGLSGYWWRHAANSWRTAIGSALMGGVFIAEGWYELVKIQDKPAGWVSILIGIIMVIFLPRSWKDRRRSFAVLLPTVLLGIGAYALLALLTS